MNNKPLTPSKLDVEKRHVVPTNELIWLATQIFQKLGCDDDIAEIIATHLVETNLMGIESHGVMRLMQYAEQMQNGYMLADKRPSITQNKKGAWIVDGNGGIGMPAMHLGVEKGIEVALQNGISTVAIGNCGHTGRLGAYAERGAEAGCLTICIGGGGHKAWPQVAPYGGAKGRLPTNPYAFGIPGGDRGPVILDIATAVIAGGWIYAAKSAGVALPQNSVIDKNGNPTRNPDDYYDGGAILPVAGPKGYGLALMAELIGEVMLAPVRTEMNWLIICIDTNLYTDGEKYQALAEEVLHEIRTCPPAPGFEKVEIPGERERELETINRGNGVAIPVQTWNQIKELVNSLCIDYP